MSLESLKCEIGLVLAEDGRSWDLGAAAITDFLRAFHEIMTKSGRNQSNLLRQVHTVLGATATQHLARILDARIRGVIRNLKDCPLSEKVSRLCRERGLTDDQGRHLLKHFLKALDEERTDKNGDIQSADVLTYWSIGQEAAYHLGGLYEGDLFNMVCTELEYLDWRLKRFRKLVEIWEIELAWSREELE